MSDSRSVRSELETKGSSTTNAELKSKLTKELVALLSHPLVPKEFKCCIVHEQSVSELLQGD